MVFDLPFAILLTTDLQKRYHHHLASHKRAFSCARNNKHDCPRRQSAIRSTSAASLNAQGVIDSAPPSAAALFCKNGLSEPKSIFSFSIQQ